MSDTKPETIDQYNQAQTAADKRIRNTLRQENDRRLPNAESKIWHAHPVWFLDGNPIVGYSKLKDCIRLLFRSGQSFEADGLTAEGKFKVAEKPFTAVDEIDGDLMQRWLEEARDVQWDYKNIAKRKGR